MIMQSETGKLSAKEKISPGDGATAVQFFAGRLAVAVVGPVISGLFKNVFLSVFYKHHQVFR